MKNMIHPVLTTVARGYKNQFHIGSAIFPLAPVDRYTGIVVEFGDEQFRLVDSSHHGTANVPRINLGYSEGVYKIDEHVLEALVGEVEMIEASTNYGIRLGVRATNTVFPMS
uniref:Uncharacterized protein n=1 Tax=Candidatus Kentrum sp. UNK TaxID=2126344 RepID=A0A451AQJ9_9GAMM|nr:MAG: hypothetical protein BECKUNK1418G_GA0071005_100244 [Candidatus Kentron sp. UNK]VFK68310.1 MAG: hypothetical protein BECKUNK1418H_GA0071006_100144 [Candidatus Kentron sp. UNK]